MSQAPPGAWLRAARVLLLAAACGWVLAQACTLLWQAGHAARLQQRVSGGQPLHAWDFAHVDAVVAPGSEGLAGARRDAEGLHAGDVTPVLDLSLGLAGRIVPVQHYRAARLTLATQVPLRIQLLLPGPRGEVIALPPVQVAPGEAAVRLPLPADQASARWLRLRVEREGSGPFSLGRLALVEPRCAAPAIDQASTGRDRHEGHGQTRPALPAECPGSTPRLLPWRATPEALLQQRDRWASADPGALLMPAGVAQSWAYASAAVQRAHWLPAASLLASVLVLAWAVRARSKGRRPGSARQLLALLGVPVLLLCLGQPDIHDDPLVLLAFLASCLAALLHPGGRHDWRWTGDAAAWHAAARFTLAGIALVAVLAAAGWALGHAPDAFRAERLPRYLAWALLQQALLLIAITPRMATRARDPWQAAALSASVFALLHLPNFGLMLATLLAGSAWARQGQRHGALLPLALSHAVLGTLLAWAATPWLLRSAEVGGRFLMPG